VRLKQAVPAAVKDLRTDERRLAWGITADDLPLVATPSALYLGDEQVPWTQVERISWKPSTLTIVEVAEVEGTGRTHSFVLTEDARLAETIRARVTSSVAWSDRRGLHPSGSVRLVGRRVPGQDLLEWQQVYEPGTDPHDPFLRAQVDQMLEALRRTIG
jgi:hypothetical protein